MGQVTFQVIDGLEKGRVFPNLATPVTIGREDENSIRLNDERVSRFHAKVQEDGGRFILTDLDSTNGTRVNGHPVQMRILQVGDQLSLGRSLLVFGSPQQVAQHRRKLRSDGSGTAGPDNHTVAMGYRNPPTDSDVDLEMDHSADGYSENEELFPDGPPEPPQGLRPVQAAQVSDVLAFVHQQIAVVLEAACEEGEGDDDDLRVDREAWQRLLQVEFSLARYLRKIADPDA